MTNVFYTQLYAGGMMSYATAHPVTTQMSWTMFERLYPYAEILSFDTGMVPSGGYAFFNNPYWDYWRTPQVPYPCASEGDGRLSVKSRVFGVMEVRVFCFAWSSLYFETELYVP